MKSRTLIILSMLLSITVSYAVGFSSENLVIPFAAGSPRVFNASLDLPKLITVLVYGKRSDGQLINHCSGVLVGERHILTAAHCVRSNGFSGMAVHLYTSNLAEYKFFDGNAYDIHTPYERILNRIAPPVNNPRAEIIDVVASRVINKTDTAILTLASKAAFINNVQREYSNLLDQDWYKVPVINRSEHLSILSDLNMLFSRQYSNITQDTPPIMVTGYGVNQDILNNSRYEVLRQLAYRGAQTPIEYRKNWINHRFARINEDIIKTDKAWYMIFFDNSRDGYKRSIPMTDHGDSGGALLQINEANRAYPFYLLGTIIGTSEVLTSNSELHISSILQTFDKRDVQCINDIINNVQGSNHC